MPDPFVLVWSVTTIVAFLPIIGINYMLAELEVLPALCLSILTLAFSPKGIGFRQIAPPCIAIIVYIVLVYNEYQHPETWGQLGRHRIENYCAQTLACGLYMGLFPYVHD